MHCDCIMLYMQTTNKNSCSGFLGAGIEKCVYHVLCVCDFHLVNLTSLHSVLTHCEGMMKYLISSGLCELLKG